MTSKLEKKTKQKNLYRKKSKKNGQGKHFYFQPRPFCSEKLLLSNIEKKFSCNLVSLSPFSYEGDYMFQSTVFTTSSSLSFYF